MPILLLTGVVLSDVEDSIPVCQRSAAVARRRWPGTSRQDRVRKLYVSLSRDGYMRSALTCGTVFWNFPSQRGSIVRTMLHGISNILSFTFIQLRNRLEAAKDAKAGYETQVEELQAQIEREKAVRPESVCVLQSFACSVVTWHE